MSGHVIVSEDRQKQCLEWTWGFTGDNGALPIGMGAYPVV